MPSLIQRATGAGSSPSGMRYPLFSSPPPITMPKPSIRPGGIPVRPSASIDHAFANRSLSGAREVMSRIGGRFSKPSLLMTVFGAGFAGAVTGDQDIPSFLKGAAAGVIGGHLAEAGAKGIYGSLYSYGKKNAGTMSAEAANALKIGKMITAKSSRNMIFAGGALLSGGLFSAMFASNSKSYKRGFNAERGNSIVR